MIKDLEKHNLDSRKWALNNPEKRRESQRKSNKKSRDMIKLEVYYHYCNGDIKCDCCGEKEIKFLSIDHINGDGKKHRKEIGASGSMLYWWLKKNNFPEGFRILCFNCNQGRQLTDDKTCPHKMLEDVSGYL